jgi:hypothetical protein
VVVVLAAGDDYDNILANQQSSSATLTSGWSAFVGSGNFDIGVLAIGQSQMTGSGNVDGGAITEATAGASVRYDYSANNAVPEPGALALVGLALGAAGLAGRRRR